MALWIELHLKFEEAYRAKPPDKNLIRRFYEYARWCLVAPSKGGRQSDASTAVLCSFYEHLPLNNSVRRDLPNWLSPEGFEELREVFRYHLSEPEFSDFESEFFSTTRRAVRKRP
ncbi:MAG: hypothetical protein RL514_1702 [Verrucomicrobiota bacterium]